MHAHDMFEFLPFESNCTHMQNINADNIVMTEMAIQMQDSLEESLARSNHGGPTLI